MITIEGNPWFVAKEVRDTLGIQKGGTAFGYLDDSEYRVIRKCGSIPLKGRGMALISEAGLYKTVIRSDKPLARTFQDWVTKVVLPSIRTGDGYIM